MERITKEDILNLKKEFDEYTKTAEQSEFGRLFLINLKLDSTINQLETNGSLNPKELITLDTEEGQAEARAIFRVILRAIGQTDRVSEYSEKDTNVI